MYAPIVKQAYRWWVGLLSFAMPFLILAQSEQDSLSFSISDSLLEASIEQIVVTGQLTPTDLSASILPVRVITQEMIAQRGATQLTEILQQEPNIRIERDPVLGTSIRMNGLSGKHINILIDGVPMVGRNGGNIDLDRIPVQNIVRIEIIENALSVAYGTNALGGTINIITQDAITSEQAQWDLALTGQYQSNQQYDAAAILGGQLGGFSLQTGYQYHRFEGFSIDTTRALLWNPKTQHRPFARLYWAIPCTGLRLGYHVDYLYESILDKGLLQIPRFPSLSYAKDYEYRTQTQDHSIRLLGYVDPRQRYYLKGWVAYNHFVREKNGYFQPLAENPDSTYIDRLDSDTTSFGAWSARWQIASDFNKKVEFTVGIDLRYDYTTGQRIENQYGTLGDYALFGTLQYTPTPTLTLHAGGRVAYNTLAPVPPVTYVAGMKWHPIAGLFVRFSYTRGIRTPSLKELYLDFVDVNHFIKGNPNLRPEYAHNLRLSGSWSKAKGESFFRTEVSLFYNYINQQIQLYSFGEDSLGNRVPDPSSLQFTYFNLDRFENWGVNARAKYQYKGLVIQLGINLTGNYNSDNQRYPALVEPFHYTLEWSQEISYTIPKTRSRLSLYRRDYDKILRYSILNNPLSDEPVVVQYSLAGYGLMDFTLTQPFFKESILLSFGVKNILDVQNIAQGGSHGGAHSSSGSALPVAMGRVWWVRLVLQPHRIQRLKNNFSVF